MSLEPVHVSTLKLMSQSPAHYRYALDNPRKPTAAMKLGALTDRFLFSDSKPVVYPGAVRRGKEFDAFEAAHPGEEIYLASEIEAAEDLARAVERHPVAMGLLDGTRQRQLTWQFVGRDCSSTPDVFTGSRVVELKTAVSANPNRFVRDAMRMGYHAQLAFYSAALKSLGLAIPTEHFIVCVESSPPYPVVIYEVSERAIDYGLRLCRMWMETLLRCEAEDHWPGYSIATVLFDVPDDDDVSLVIDGELAEVA
jgi:hypothetical protein